MIHPSKNPFFTFGLSCFLLLVPIALSFSQEAFTEKNIKYIYNPKARIQLEYNTYFKEDSVTTLFTIHLNDSDTVSFENETQLIANFLEGYSSRILNASDTLSLNEVLIKREGRNYYCKYDFPLYDDTIFLELIISNDGDNTPFNISLNREADYSLSGITAYDSNGSTPYLKKFVNPGTRLTFYDMNSTFNELWVYYYDNEFEISVPPMIVDNDNVSRTLSISTQRQIFTGSAVSFDRPGLYFIQKDTSTLNGYALRVEESPFPVFGTYGDLVKPLKYISTREEYETLQNASNKKAAFENFWVKITGSREVAKEKINWFYDRVAEANHFFTGYKEGWKTDMGMIYIIYGQPDEVFHHNDYEEWVYEQNVKLPAVRFTFVKIKNVFDRNHYSLVRNKKFDKHWFRAIEIWRSKE